MIFHEIRCKTPIFLQMSSPSRWKHIHMFTDDIIAIFKLPPLFFNAFHMAPLFPGHVVYVVIVWQTYNQKSSKLLCSCIFYQNLQLCMQNKMDVVQYCALWYSKCLVAVGDILTLSDLEDIEENAISMQGRLFCTWALVSSGVAMSDQSSAAKRFKRASTTSWPRSSRTSR